MATQTTEVVSKNMVALERILTDSQDQLAAVLPKHIGIDKFLYVALDLIRGTPGLHRAIQSPEGRLSILKAVLEASEMGLLLTRHLGHGYLVPYKNGDLSKHVGHEVVEVQFQIGYRGFLELVREADDAVRTVFGRIVWPGEQFSLDEAQHQIYHIPNPQGGTIRVQQSGETAGYEGAYAKVIYENGQQDFEWMPLHEIEKVRRSSKAQSEDSPWRRWPEEMIKKTPMRRLCKRLKLTPERLAGVVRDEYRDLGVEHGSVDVKPRIQMPRRLSQAAPPVGVPPESPKEPDYSLDIPPLCPFDFCAKAFKLVPAGYSQKSRRNYPAFFVCPDHQDAQHKKAGSKTILAKNWHEQEQARLAAIPKHAEPVQVPGREPGDEITDDDVPF